MCKMILSNHDPSLVCLMIVLAVFTLSVGLAWGSLSAFEIDLTGPRGGPCDACLSGNLSLILKIVISTVLDSLCWTL